MNHVSQHAFEAGWPRECCNTISLKPIDDLSEMPGFLLRSLTILICGEVSMLSASIRKMFHLDMFVLETVQKEIFVNMQNSAKFVWHVFHCQESLLREW